MGQAIDLGTGLFGTASGQSSRGTMTSGTNFQGQDINSIRDAQARLSSLVGNATTNTPTLNNNFVRPNFGTNLDPTAQNLVSGELARQRAGTDASVRAIGQKIQNPGVSQILQQQTKNAGNLQANPLAFNASQEQQQRVAQQAGAQNQVIGQQNQTAVQQQGLANNQVGLQQNLLSSLLGVGQAMGSQYTSQNQQSQGRSGGLIGK